MVISLYQLILKSWYEKTAQSLVKRFLSFLHRVCYNSNTMTCWKNRLRSDITLKKGTVNFFMLHVLLTILPSLKGYLYCFFFLSWQPWLVLGCGFGPLNSHCEWEMLWCCSKDYGKCDTNVFWLSRETYTGSKVMPVMFKGFQITITPPMKAK